MLLDDSDDSDDFHLQSGHNAQVISSNLPSAEVSSPQKFHSQSPDAEATILAVALVHLGDAATTF